MSGNSANSALQALLMRLNANDRSQRFAAIREVSHVFQRPDLATCDALIEIGHQLALFRDAYELVNNVQERRISAVQREKDAYNRGYQEAMAKAPPPPPPPPPQRRQPLNAILRTDEFHVNVLHLSVRTYRLLTEDGEQGRTKEELLGFEARNLPGFGKTCFAELVVGLLRYAKVKWSTMESSILWNEASPKMREAATAAIQKWKEEDNSPEKEPNVTEMPQ